MRQFYKVRSILLVVSILFVCNFIQGQTVLTYNYTGSSTSWVVPAGVTSVKLDAYGAQGGSSLTGAYGGHIQSTHTVTPGSTLYIYVGGQGTSGTGGYNGGGTPTSTGFGGGGASDK